MLLFVLSLTPAGCCDTLIFRDKWYVFDGVWEENGYEIWRVVGSPNDVIFHWSTFGDHWYVGHGGLPTGNSVDAYASYPTSEQCPIGPGIDATILGYMWDELSCKEVGTTQVTTTAAVGGYGIKISTTF